MIAAVAALRYDCGRMRGSTRETGAPSVREAKAAVARWVRGVAAAASGVEAACLAGSVAGLVDDAALPPGSDVDVWLVLADGAYPSDRGERFVQVDGLSVDVAYLPGAALRSSERILGDHSRAYAFARPNLLFDGDGRLTEVQAAVAAEYADRVWLQRRCEDAFDRLRKSVRRRPGGVAVRAVARPGSVLGLPAAGGRSRGAGGGLEDARRTRVLRGVA